METPVNIVAQVTLSYRSAFEIKRSVWRTKVCLISKDSWASCSVYVCSSSGIQLLKKVNRISVLFDFSLNVK